MVETGQMPDRAKKRYLQNLSKEARRSFRDALAEVGALQAGIAAAMNELDRAHSQLSTRLERMTRDLERLDDIEASK